MKREFTKVEKNSTIFMAGFLIGIVFVMFASTLSPSGDRIGNCYPDSITGQSVHCD